MSQLIFEYIEFIFILFTKYLIPFAILIVVLVFVHEFGHFLFARLFGVKVESFSIGFGKALFSFTDKKGTIWKIAPLPLGGYVKMKGEMLPTSGEVSKDKDAFHNKQLWQKALIVFAGPLFNLLLPIIIFFIVPFFIGMSTLKPKILNVIPNSPSHNILFPGDVVTKINNQPIKVFQDIGKIISKIPNKDADISILRNNKEVNVKIKVGEKLINSNIYGYLGIEANLKSTFNKKYGFLESLKISYELYKTTLFNILYGFKLLITSKLSAEDIGGPVKIAQLSGDILKNGLNNWMFFLAALSINLAIVNLVPIPALDGGYLFLYLIQFIARRPIPAKVQSILITCGFFLLLTLIILITLHDIFRLFR